MDDEHSRQGSVPEENYRGMGTVALPRVADAKQWVLFIRNLSRVPARLDAHGSLSKAVAVASCSGSDGKLRPNEHVVNDCGQSFLCHIIKINSKHNKCKKRVATELSHERSNRKASQPSDPSAVSEAHAQSERRVYRGRVVVRWTGGAVRRPRHMNDERARRR
ncbi:hypothetical protein BDZ97DRAFT_1760121 [Flammula alnicola]|nr:hypothetical protein BDZ97DRAFT_1760121 [Flammula alnicola]